MKRTVKELVLEQFKFNVTKPIAIYKALNGFAGRASIYSAFAQLKKEGKITKTPKGYVLTPVNKNTKETKQITSTPRTEYVRNLEQNVIKLSELNQQLNNQNTALKIDLLDQTAIINYLEKKLGV